MFSLDEAANWSAEEAIIRLEHVIPASWNFECSRGEDGWFRASLVDEDDQLLWSGEHADQKILVLDALGWFRLRKHQTKSPAWKLRKGEVPLYRPPVSETVPEPPDLDPAEVEMVYRKHKDK